MDFFSIIITLFTHNKNNSDTPVRIKRTKESTIFELITGLVILLTWLMIIKIAFFQENPYAASVEYLNLGFEFTIIKDIWIKETTITIGCLIFLVKPYFTKRLPVPLKHITKENLLAYTRLNRSTAIFLSLLGPIMLVLTYYIDIDPFEGDYTIYIFPGYFCIFVVVIAYFMYKMRKKYISDKK
ncbi:MAG: hypothetical protein J5918_06565 [Prevotella sp.]|nr:hypothetical protein [Prevotella sp.]